jgi:hypothetical protein
MNATVNHDDTINIKSYPERIISIIPLPSWLAWVIFWQLLFLMDYLMTLNADDTNAYSLVFACINLFFASVCIATIYCSKVLIRLYPHLTRFIEEDQDILKSWYALKLKSCYESYGSLSSGMLISVGAIASIYPLVRQLTPAGEFLFYYRLSYLGLGFFFLGTSLWALIKVTLIPMDLTQMKVKVSITQFSGNGLQALGSSFLKMSLSIAVSFILIVLAAIVAPFENNIIVLIWLGLAAILIFGFFLLPQVGIHRVMVNEKTNRMSGFTNHLEEAMDRTLKNPSAENMQRLKELFEVQNHLKGMNEWPFDLTSIWQLLTALIIPIILAAIEIFFKS